MATHNPPQILIADDEEYFREIFSVKLKSLGYAVEVVHNGKEAVDHVVHAHPDLVLMDVRMPEMNGIEAFLKLKATNEMGDTKVLFLTNLGEPNEGGKELNDHFAQEIGATGYVRKTDDIDTLVRAVKKILT